MAVTARSSSEGSAAQNPAYRSASQFFENPPTMSSEALRSWRGPRWALSLLLACLSMMGPFAIDTYLPAFEGMARSLAATPVQMQQTLSSYLLAFAVMNLFHGALSDSIGRRPLVVGGTALFALASAGCALAGDYPTLLFFRVLQGMSAGAGMVVARAIVRDLFAPADAQRAMSQITLFFSAAPIIAPLIGGLLYTLAGWASIFWFLAAVAGSVCLANARWLPESLPPDKRQPLKLSVLLRGYAGLLRRPRLWALVAAGSLPFNAFFLYVLAAPAFLGEGLGLRPTQYFVFFLITTGGIMLGAFGSGRLAGRIAPARQVGLGQMVMAVAMAAHLAVNFLLPVHAATHMAALGLYSFGWALLVPVVTIMTLDQAPERRGMVSSLQSCLSATGNALVAGALAPLVMHSLQGLALASAGLWAAGAIAWWLARRRSD
jgi:MFS transporter, DHA1 family, multidrug resistance protein